jgi:DNA-directed RNA polymerase beta subunit
VSQDATPFTFHEQSRVIDHFGEQLTAAGYAYYGSEPLYSGLSGTVMHADIFIGLVYYQRLRHMVSDKSQVRVCVSPHYCMHAQCLQCTLFVACMHSSAVHMSFVYSL